jgi:hypothetical protein
MKDPTPTGRWSADAVHNLHHDEHRILCRHPYVSWKRGWLGVTHEAIKKPGSHRQQAPTCSGLRPR